MVPFDWFKERIGKRVVVEIEGILTQSWRVYMTGAEVVVLVHPSKSKHLDQVAVFYRGMRRYLDLGAPGRATDVIGGRRDPRGERWHPITRAEYLRAKLGRSGIPDHLPDDIA